MNNLDVSERFFTEYSDIEEELSIDDSPEPQLSNLPEPRLINPPEPRINKNEGAKVAPSTLVNGYGSTSGKRKPTSSTTQQNETESDDDLEQSLQALEKLDRSSPDLWPDQVLLCFIAKNISIRMPIRLNTRSFHMLPFLGDPCWGKHVCLSLHSSLCPCRGY